MKLVFRLICYHIPFLRFLLGCPMEFSIVRHAKSERNFLTKNWNFSGDDSQRDLLNKPDHLVDLVEEGHRQAELSGPGITATIMPDVIITSGYNRTVQTLEGIKKGSNAWDHIPVKTDLLIRERETGYGWVILDQPHHEVFPYLPEYWQQFGNLFSRPVGGESILDMVDNRLKLFIAKIRKNYSGKKVCIVSHGRVKSGYRFILEDLTISQMEDLLVGKGEFTSPKNVGLTVYRYNPWSGRLELVFYNKIFY